MFNLIIRSVDWNTGRETMPIARTLEYTDEHIGDQFKINEALLLDQLIKLPCLFMQEGVADEIAYVGRINQARISGSDIAFEFSLDTEIPPMQNGMIYENRIELDISDAVKSGF